MIKPDFLTSPQTQTAVEGDTVTLSATVSGTPPFGYRWRRNGRTVVSFEAGGPTLTLTNVQLTDAGRYTVVVTNGARLAGVLSGSGILTVLEDTDGDRLPDVWEIANGLDPEQPGDGVKDLDGDSLTAREEYVAGTDPKDEGSYLRIAEVVRGLDQTEVTFESVSNKNYTVQFKESPSEGLWTRLVDVLASPSNHLRTVVDPYPPTEERIYRLLTPMHVPPPPPGPVILLSPRSQTVYNGSDVRFGVDVFGAEPLSYRWRFNDSAIQGATQPQLEVRVVQTNNIGSYTVSVSDADGSITSQPAELVVLVPPVIVTQPESQSVPAGASVTFRVEATGFEPLSYWWYFNGVPLLEQRVGWIAGRAAPKCRKTRFVRKSLELRISESIFAGFAIVNLAMLASLLAPALKYFQLDPAQADWISFAFGFTVITFLHIVVGELAPKSLAIQKPLATSLWVAQPLRWFYVLFYPLIWVLNHAAFWLLRRVGIQPVSEAELAHSEEEIRLLLAETRRHTNGPTLGQDIALNAFALRHRRVREVMRPRHEIVALNTEATTAERLALARQTRYSRFPLCEGGDLDKTLGVVISKDLVDLQHEAQRGHDLAAVARKILFVPETARLETLLTLFLQRKLHLALVVDEYGGTVGLLTLENVLEELVGPIEDEFDQEEPLMHQTGEHAWELSGSLPAHKLAEVVDERFEETAEASTVSGLVMQRLGRFPQVGDTLALGAWELRVEELVGTRVAKLKLSRRVENGGGRPARPPLR
jgi:CBS domain containing-hemolysin-like protein